MDYKRFALFKLVRALTAKQLEEKGLLHDIKILTRPKYLYKLKYKLIEEAREVLRTNNKRSLIEELGDVFEVFQLILNENKIAMSDILQSISLS